MSKYLLSLSVGLLLVAAQSASYAQTPVEISVGGATIVKANRDISALVSGNPQAIPASLIDPRTVSIIGKAPGTAVLIAIDESGQEIARWTVQVGARQTTVSLIQGRELNETDRYNCNPICTLVEEQSADVSTTEVTGPNDALLSKSTTTTQPGRR
jgi:hypothetical protein